MPEFEQVCRRLFCDSAWLGKCLLGAVLMAVPILHFFAFGYFGRLAAGAARGERFDLPQWRDWRELFISGVMYFVIFLGLAGGIFLIAWILSLPFRPWTGVLAYLPYMPAMIVAPPLVGAGWYRFARTGDLVEAFRFTELFRLLHDAGFGLILPTLAFVGFLFVGAPLFPLAFFIGGLVVFYFYSSIFCHIDAGGADQPDIPFSVL